MTRVVPPVIDGLGASSAVVRIQLTLPSKDGPVGAVQPGIVGHTCGERGGGTRSGVSSRAGYLHRFIATFSKDNGQISVIRTYLRVHKHFSTQCEKSWGVEPGNEAISEMEQATALIRFKIRFRNQSNKLQ